MKVRGFFCLRFLVRRVKTNFDWHQTYYIKCVLRCQSNFTVTPQKLDSKKNEFIFGITEISLYIWSMFNTKT